jgi:4'-phosphopantetheinyl transferase
LGIDLEHIRSNLNYEQLAEHFFSLREITELRALPANLRRKSFFNCWTRKEAYLKARGQGLTFPLNQFDVSLIPSEPAVLRKVRGSPDEATRWAVHELTPGCGYVAALVVEGHNWRLSCWQWTGEEPRRLAQ